MTSLQAAQSQITKAGFQIPTLLRPDLSTLGAQLIFLAGIVLAALVLEWFLRKHFRMGILGLIRRNC